jgi:hypothetical protein
MTDDVSQVNLSEADALDAEAAAYEALAAAKRARAAVLRSAPAKAELLNVDQAQNQYGFGRDALLNASQGGLTLVRGSRNRIMVERAALEAYIKSRPVVQRTRKAPADLGEWDQQAERALVGLKGGRR